MKEKVLIITHLAIILAAYTAFIWADWKLVLSGVLIYWAQIIFFGTCVLSAIQFNNKETSFIMVYANKLLGKFGKELSMKKSELFLDWIMPMTFLVLAYCIQSFFGVTPLLKL